MNPSSTGYNLQGTSTGQAQRSYKPFKETSAPKGFNKYSLRQFDPQQMELYNQSFGFLGPESYLQRLAGGDEQLFNQIEAPAMRQFAGLQGDIASRFSGAGSLGGRRSSGFQNEIGGAASNFAQQLQAQRQGLQQGALNDLMRYSQMLLGQRPYERGFAEKQQRPQQGGFGGAASGAASGALAGSVLGPWGALGGGILGGIAGYF